MRLQSIFGILCLAFFGWGCAAGGPADVPEPDAGGNGDAEGPEDVVSAEDGGADDTGEENDASDTSDSGDCACEIDGECRADGEASPESPCLVCDPAESTTSYSPVSDGTSCGDRRTCQQGSCECEGGLTECGGNCVDTTSSDTHCGGCNQSCDGECQSCEGGACTDSDDACADGERCDGGMCVECIEDGDCEGCNTCNGGTCGAPTNLASPGASCSGDCDCASRECVGGTCAHRIFVTSTKTTGELRPGIDSSCAEASASAGLGGNWKTVLSTDAEPASSRIVRASGAPVVNTCGDEVLAASESLWNNGLANPIACDENGSRVGSSARAWTGTDANGDARVQQCANDWDTDFDEAAGSLGNPNATDTGWIASGTSTCEVEYRVYCIDGQ